MFTFDIMNLIEVLLSHNPDTTHCCLTKGNNDLTWQNKNQDNRHAVINMLFHFYIVKKLIKKIYLS